MRQKYTWYITENTRKAMMQKLSVTDKGCVDEKGTEEMANWIIPNRSCENFGFTLRELENN